MTISVVIPAYNEEKYIAQCLDGLQHQTVKPDEIIVVNNNSDDKTIAIAEKYHAYIIHEKQQGIIHARNAGFNAVRSDIIARCDADTIPAYDWIERIISDFTNQTIDAISGPIFFHDLPMMKTFNLPSKMYAQFMKKLQGHETLLGPNMALTKLMWNKVKNEVCLDDTKVHEYIDLALHVKKYGTILFDPALCVHTSARRMRSNVFSFFVEYPIRFIKTLNQHN